MIFRTFNFLESVNGIDIRDYNDVVDILVHRRLHFWKSLLNLHACRRSMWQNSPCIVLIFIIFHNIIMHFYRTLATAVMAVEIVVATSVSTTAIVVLWRRRAGVNVWIEQQFPWLLSFSVSKRAKSINLVQRNNEQSNFLSIHYNYRHCYYWPHSPGKRIQRCGVRKYGKEVTFWGEAHGILCLTTVSWIDA